MLNRIICFVKQKFVVLCLVFCTQLFLLNGCNTNKETNEEVIKIELPETIDDKYEVSNGLIIKLETTDEILLGFIMDVKLRGDTVFVLDEFGKRLYLFHRNGKYIDKIENVGKGPLEYLRINDFALYENEIYVLGQKEIVVFDATNLKAQRKIKLDFYALSLFVGDKNIILSTHQCESGYILNYMSKLNHNINKYMESAIKSGDNGLRLVYSAYKFNPIPDDGKSLFHYSYGDIIFIVSDSGYQCAYQVDLKDKCVPNYILAKNPDAIENYSKNNDYLHIDKCFQFGKNLIICLNSSMDYNYDTYDFLINTPTGTSHYNSIVEKNLGLPINIIGTCSAGFIGSFSSEELDEKRGKLLTKVDKGEELSPDEKNFLAEFKDNTNPYLIVFNLKD